MPDSLGFPRRVGGLPEQLADAHDGAATPPARCRRRRHRPRRRARHGRVGDRRRRPRRRRQRDAPGAGGRAQADPHAPVRRAAHARLRGLLLGRHRRDALRWPTGAPMPARIVAVSERRALAEARDEAPCTCRARTASRARGGLGALMAPCSSCCQDGPHARGARRGSGSAGRQLRRRDEVPARGRGDGESGPRDRPQDRDARSRSSTAAARSAPSPLRWK